MRRSGLAGAAACLLASLGPARAQDIGGAWSGTYECLQGVTALDLLIEERKGGTLTALFHFQADPSNPGVPEGCFNMRGSYDAQTRQLTLHATTWVRRPAGYVTVDLEGRRNRSGDLLAGRVLAESCTGFTLRPATEPVRACRPAPDRVAALAR